MDCPNWPPPLPSLPVFPPCSLAPISEKPPPRPVQLKESQTQEWWNGQLEPFFARISGTETARQGKFYELTRKQRKELLSIKSRTREHKLISSVPLPDGSYPRDGLPIWDRLYLDRKLPMLECPPDALVFARQKIGKKLWKDTGRQEFVLYDPYSYEVKFSYENLHDPHLSTYYEGNVIRQFLLNQGDTNEDGWGLCSLKRFNQYRNYLKIVHLSMVHSYMEKQEALKNEVNQMKEYRRTTEKMMERLERQTMMDEIRAAIVEVLRQERLNKMNRLLENIRAKEDRIRKLQKMKLREKEIRKQRGLRLLAERELKNKIAKEIERRKKIATLRLWHDTEEKTMRQLKKMADEKAEMRAEKVRVRWQNKIDTLNSMLEREDEYLKLQEKVRAENIKIRNALTDREKNKEKERFQEIRKEGIKKKVYMQKLKGNNRMEKAIIDSWISIRQKEHGFDLATELYRVKKSINSTIAELQSSQMEGPDRFSIILLSRNRIQGEQKIVFRIRQPIQVSFAIDAVLETAIQKWAKIRLMLILETVTAQVIENGRKELANIKARYKDFGAHFSGSIKASDPRGKIYQPDPEEPKVLKKWRRKKSVKEALEVTANEHRNPDETSERIRLKRRSSKSESPQTDEVPTPVVPNYVHYGSTTIHEYPPEYELSEELKSVTDRPKTPMPTQEDLCQAGFFEEKLKDILPTFADNVKDLKEKRKFRKVFKNVAVQLFKRSIEITKIAFEPVTRVRAVNKLVFLEDIDKTTLTNTLCFLVMNTEEKIIHTTEEFEWLSKGVAKTAIKEVLNPSVFSKEPDDGVARTKIMFYAPKQRRLRKP